jgi:hypothetical protein
VTKFAALAFERRGPGRLDQHALPAQMGKDAADHGSGKRETLFFE